MGVTTTSNEESLQVWDLWLRAIVKRLVVRIVKWCYVTAWQHTQICSGDNCMLLVASCFWPFANSVVPMLFNSLGLVASSRCSTDTDKPWLTDANCLFQIRFEAINHNSAFVRRSYCERRPSHAGSKFTRPDRPSELKLLITATLVDGTQEDVMWQPFDERRRLWRSRQVVVSRAERDDDGESPVRTSIRVPVNVAPPSDSSLFRPFVSSLVERWTTD